MSTSIDIPLRDLSLAKTCGVQDSVITEIAQLPDPLPSLTNPKGLEYPVETRKMAAKLRSMGISLRKVAKIIGMASENNVRTACEAVKNGTLYNHKSPFDNFVDSVMEDNGEFFDDPDKVAKELETRYQALTPDMKELIQLVYRLGYSDGAGCHDLNKTFG